MKVFAIQTNQKNIPQFKQTNSENLPPVMKTNLSRDKFVTKVAFGASIEQVRSELAVLTEKVSRGQLTEEAYEKLASPIRSKISELIRESIQAFNRRPKGLLESLFGSKESDATWNRLISQAPEIHNINVWEAKVARLQKRLGTEILSENTRIELKEEIDHLEFKISEENNRLNDSGEHYCDPASYGADHPFD